MRARAGDLAQRLDGHELAGAGAHGHDVVIEMAQEERMQVHEVARDVERADHALVPADPMHPHRHARDQQAALLGRGALCDDGGPALVVAPADRHGGEGSAILLPEHVAPAEEELEEARRRHGVYQSDVGSARHGRGDPFLAQTAPIGKRPAPRSGAEAGAPVGYGRAPGRHAGRSAGPGGGRMWMAPQRHSPSNRMPAVRV